MIRAVLNRQIAEEAADWVVRLDGRPLDETERRALADWLRASPVHVEELMCSASIMGALHGVDRDGRLSVEDLLAQTAPEVIPLFKDAAPMQTMNGVEADGLPPAGRRPVPKRWWALAASLAAVAMTGFLLTRSPAPEAAGTLDPAREASSRLFATDLGEQRSITLADGSVVFLNTSSRVRIRMSAGERGVDLLRGEALFEVAHDPDRPFRVYAAGTVAQAVGTKFNVKRTDAAIQVAVVEGKVLVDSHADRARAGSGAALSGQPGPLPADQALLTMGQQARLKPHAAVPIVEDADLLAVTSWRMRQLSFDNAGLAEIVAEFNRYNRTPIELAEPALNKARFSGVFDANDPESFIAFLELSTAVEVDRSQAGRITLKPKRN